MKDSKVWGKILLLVGLLSGCADEKNYDVYVQADAGSQPINEDTDAGSSGETSSDAGCADVDSSEAIPARSVTLEGQPPVTEQTIYVDDLFESFSSQCGGCHVDVAMGGYQTSRAQFAVDVDQSWVDSMRLNQEGTVMPPPSVGGKIYRKRAADDPSNILANQLEAWVKAGRPVDLFKVPVAGTERKYRFSPAQANALTNIGTCIPEKSTYATEKTQMAAMDSKFAAMSALPAGKGTLAERIGLPVKLSDTDLTTFDSLALARRGVISYASTYPQWVGPDARVMRHLRLPLGSSIKFDRNTQNFVIPEGTRFYRTIVQRVVEPGAGDRWRKMETQVVVAWNDYVNKDGETFTTSLYGTYAWNEDESEATLVTDPNRNGEPFRDRLVTFIVDPKAADSALAKKPSNRATALRDAHAMRSYAIPGSKRCGQCHRGSPTSNFVLGMIPLQVARRKAGEGGVLDVPEADELSQLKRLLDLGVIVGLSDVADIQTLEASQNKRKPRNDYELKAQGYLLGNCAHCHNPKGDGTTGVEELKNNILDFLPSSTGGIFGFSLDTMSPRTFRAGGTGSVSVPMPYITPSLMEIGKTGSDPTNLDVNTDFWIPKCKDNYLMAAPWRSLIYRGVDTPFTYSDDLALIPHMPLNTQGFDCRAPRIIGDWMVSIPSETLPIDDSPALEYAFYSTSVQDSYCPSVDTRAQPYVEAKSGRTGYKNDVTSATSRLRFYHTSPITQTDVAPTMDNPVPDESLYPSRYNFCPDTFDILDPDVMFDPAKNIVPLDADIYAKNKLIMPRDRVPNHAHWVILDTTQVPSAWAPRRLDWYEKIVSLNYPPIVGTGIEVNLRRATDAQAKYAASLLKKVVLTDELKSLAADEFPLGLWSPNTACKYPGVKSVSSYAKYDKLTTTKALDMAPAWIARGLANQSIRATDRVYATTPGEYVHNLICANCHGVLGNTSGGHSNVLSDMTGGKTVVTNLIDGMMVPANRKPVFSTAPLQNATVEDWAARYFTWMALGGTQKAIPQSLLALVAATKVLGQSRPFASPPTDANMLSSAVHFCAATLPALDFILTGGTGTGAYYSGSTSKAKSAHFGFEDEMFVGGTQYKNPLLFSNGDVLAWERICSVNNPPPVRALSIDATSTRVTIDDFYPPELYPRTAAIRDHRGRQIPASPDRSRISQTNYFPWCVRRPRDANYAAVLKLLQDGGLDESDFCPETDINGKPYISKEGATDSAHLTRDALYEWVTRGAINAGFLVYEYLDQLAAGDLAPTPAYDQCAQLDQ